MGIIVNWVNHPIEAIVVAEYPTYLVMERQTDSGSYRFCIQKADLLREGDNEKSGIYTT